MSFKGYYLIAVIITAIVSINPPVERFSWALVWIVVLTFLIALDADIEVNKPKKQIDKLEGKL